MLQVRWFPKFKKEERQMGKEMLLIAFFSGIGVGIGIYLADPATRKWRHLFASLLAGGGCLGLASVSFKILAHLWNSLPLSFLGVAGAVVSVLVLFPLSLFFLTCFFLALCEIEECLSRLRGLPNENY